MFKYLKAWLRYRKKVREAPHYIPSTSNLEIECPYCGTFSPMDRDICIRCARPLPT